VRAARWIQRYWLARLAAAAALLGPGALLGALVGCDAGGEAGTRELPSPAPPADSQPVVLFLGDSLTAGYGLPSDEAFPARIQERIERAGLGYRVVNAGVSGDTSAGGLRRIDWLLRQPVAVLVLELGGNDMLRGQDLGALRVNLRGILEATRSAHPDASLVIAGMRAPPNLGASYVAGFEAVFAELAAESGAALIPFVLESVAAVPRLNQADGIHPTAEGHRRVADTVWETLEPILRGRQGR
jgi:acyl-CoA thioesterase-1